MFYNFEKLSEINFPETWEAVREYAFYNCDALTSIDLPSNVQVIENYAFYDKENNLVGTYTGKELAGKKAKVKIKKNNNGK